MNKHKIIFSLESLVKMILPFKDDLTVIDYCYELPIILDMGSKKIILANVFVYYAMQKISSCLTRALNNELLMHESINKDIGYLYNEYSYNASQDISRFVETTSRGKSFWVGYEYYVWSSCLKNSSYATWIYNSVDGEIVFEVTPLYVEYDPTPGEDCNYYKKWIESYKPYLIKKISKEIAQQWLEQANHIMLQIDSNIARWKREEFGEI